MCTEPAPCAVTAGVGRGTMQVLQFARSVTLGPTAAPKVYTTTAPLRRAISYNVDVPVFDGRMIRRDDYP